MLGWAQVVLLKITLLLTSHTEKPLDIHITITLDLQKIDLIPYPNTPPQKKKNNNNNNNNNKINK